MSVIQEAAQDMAKSAGEPADPMGRMLIAQSADVVAGYVMSRRAADFAPTRDLIHASLRVAYKLGLMQGAVDGAVEVRRALGGGDAQVA